MTVEGDYKWSDHSKESQKEKSASPKYFHRIQNALILCCSFCPLQIHFSDKSVVVLNAILLLNDILAFEVEGETTKKKWKWFCLDQAHFLYEYVL